MANIPAPTTPALAGNAYDRKEPRTPASMMNRSSPVDAQLRTGDVLVDLITQLNNAIADMVAFRIKYQAFLTHVDTGNVAGIGNANVATYGMAALTQTAIQQLGAR